MLVNMLADTIQAQEPPGLTNTPPEGDMEDVDTMDTSTNGQPKSGNWNGSIPAGNQFPPPKTDKPRPHVCATCTRSFARLEHLKRHERSHTKEKPFECPECTRCFARRDLLLRHQQKLHLTATPSSRSRSTRRESTSGSISGAKVRKNSQSTQGGIGNMRPRANTISHIDALGLMGAVQPPPRRRPTAAHNRHASLADFGNLVPSGPRAPSNRMLKINTHGLNSDVGGSLRTAPAFGGFPTDMGMENLFFGGSNTINPAQLHFADSPHSMAFESPASPFPPGYQFGNLSMEETDTSNFDWITGFDQHMSFANAHEHAIAGSSPSAMSGGSPGQGDAMNDSQMHLTPEEWQDSLLSQAPMVPRYNNDWGLSSEMNQDPLSPTSMDQSGPEVKFPTPAFNTNSLHPGFQNTLFGFGSQTNSPNTAASVSSGSNRHSSVTSVATDVVTDATRQSLIALLAQLQSPHKKYAQPAVSSPLSPGYTQRPRSAMGGHLPSTAELQRYVNSYINNFHPRLPFLHIPTLNFDPTGTANGSRAKLGFPFPPATGDNGCLLLSMAAIGAQFEFDYGVSKDLFDQAKKLIHHNLEERRRADMCVAIGATTNGVDGSTTNTPIWLVQAMLLNVIYGHNCGDRPPADLAGTHCAALVGLARAAGLTKASDPHGMEDMQMNKDMWGTGSQSFDDSTWFTWKLKEERKRTLYSIFVVSSVLVSLYNFPPSLTNSEIGLNLPCEENLWAAETPAAWFALGASPIDQGIPFAKALSSLLTTSQRHPLQAYQLQAQNRPSPELPPAQFFTSSFGCLVLINALHNYIWETRQRHLGRQWTTQEIEAMQAHIGPAILAYQAILRDATNRSDQRANGQASSNLAADCTPFLDLAFVRLFLALGKAKENFWGHDWDAIAREIASGCDIITRTNSASNTLSESNRDSKSPPKDLSGPDSEIKIESEASLAVEKASRRERHLRKAAAHAAHSLHTADAQGISLADFPSREVNLGSAICALECSEILAEWVAVLQERMGRYVGLLGQGQTDQESVPGLMLLDSEDTALLQKIETIVRNAENKLDTFQAAARADQAQPTEEKKYGALASRLLKVAARECDGAATWSVMNLMARNLEAQAEHMQARAERSLIKTE